MTTRRSQIKRVAAKLFVESGVAGTSVRDIADGVGLLSGSLYHHFPSKDAIAFAIIDDFLRDLISRYESVHPHVHGMRAELRALVHSSIEIATRHPYATEIYQNERFYHGPNAPAPIAAAVQRAHEFWLDTAFRARDSGELRAELDPPEFARMVRDGVWWSVRHHRESLAEQGASIADTLLAVFVDGGAVPAPTQQSGPEASHDIRSRLAVLEARVAALENGPDE
ncbi:TetR family transcriptional regulator [Dietzia sp. NCCP-2495]|uniref:TetR/AcrR family transcriptional regulator n=1 Tax=Dietzia sp. NCCP-2495 TaxID=2934675 RepID=UPI00223224D1|nr:TetR/AcrR family transcriptional regulator [Dietzia sp. NCCP-2495]GLB63408.1 TetR family transcriptional regulator [Dietzia sp. NCCP-2495]